MWVCSKGQEKSAQVFWTIIIIKKTKRLQTDYKHPPSQSDYSI